MQVLFYNSELKIGQHNRSCPENKSEEQILSKIVALSRFVDHNLHTLRILLHDLLNELLCNFPLVH